MKNYSLSRFIKFIPIFSIVFILACSQESEDLVSKEGKLTIQFGVNIPNGKVSNEDSIDQIIVSLSDINGQPILENYKVNIYKIGEQYTSDAISLEEGVYQITKFGVLSDNEVLYATPLKESKLAYLVNMPLPVEFIVGKGKETSLSLEVIPTKTVDPINFGFTSFNFGIVTPFAFHLKVYAYDADQDRYIATTAELEVIANENSLTSFSLNDSINTIWLRSDIHEYKFLLEKEGYRNVEDIYQTDELIQNQDSVYSIYLDLLPTVKVYSQKLLYAPLYDQSSKTFMDMKSGLTYALSELENNTSIQQLIDIGYFYGVENGPSFSSLDAYPVSVYDMSWSYKNATHFKSTNISSAKYVEFHKDHSFITQAYDNAMINEDPGRAIHLKENEVIAFKLSGDRGGKKGLILIKSIIGTTGLGDYIEFEIAIIE